MIKNLNKFYYDPVVVIIFLAILDFVVWLITPMSIFESRGISIKGNFTYGLIGLILFITAISAGKFIQIFFDTKPIPRVVTKFHNFSVFNVVVLALVIFSIGVIVVYGIGSLSALKQSIKGYYNVNYLPGVTTFADLTTFSIIFLFVVYHYYHPSERPERVVIFFVLFGMIAVFRSLITAERLVVFLPAVSCAIAYCVLKNYNLRNILSTGIVVVSLVLSLFAFTEVWRSYNTKMGYGLEENFWEYTSKRFLIYYGSSVNNGVWEYESLLESKTVYPLFPRTIGPVGTIVYSITEQPIYLGKGSVSERAYLSSFRAFNKEFNNSWGILNPFMEGHIWGFIYWMIWGMIASRLRRVVVSGNATIFQLSSFVMVFGAFIDVNRVNVLAGTTFLVPFLFLQLASKIWPKKQLS